MRTITVWLFAGLLPCAACDSGSGRHSEGDSRIEAEARADSVDLFPLIPGTVRIYKGHIEDRPILEVVATEDPVRWPTPDGAGELAVPVVQRLWQDGQVVEETTEWFTVAVDGAIWKLGEVSREWTGRGLERTADSWEAYRNGALPTLYLPATLRPGDHVDLYLQHETERLYVASHDAEIVTPAGTFDGCTEIHENPDTEDEDIVLLSPGTGIVLIAGAGSRKVLVRSTRRR